MSKTRYVAAQGVINPRIAIVGEAGGAVEEQTGLPFQGKSGELLNAVLAEVGIKREDCYITNVVKFRPLSNRTPSAEEILEWTPLLLEELKVIKPEVVVCMGNVALKAVAQNLKLKISKERGKLFKTNFLNTRSKDPLSLLISSKEFKYVATYHPAFYFNRKHIVDQVIADFKLALENSSAQIF